MADHYCSIVGSTNTIIFSGEIDDESSSIFICKFESLKAELSGNTDKEITVYLNSGGGSTVSALAMFNVMKDYSENLKIIANGIVGSAATILLYTSENVESYSNSIFLLHEPSWCFSSNLSNLKTGLNTVEKIRDIFLNIYCQREKSKEFITTEKLATDWWLSAEEALEIGLINKLI